MSDLKPQPKKIVYLAPALSVGGAEMFLSTLVNAFTGSGTEQVLVSLSARNPLRYAFDPGIRYHEFPRRSLTDLAPAKALCRFLKEEDPDIIFCLNFFSFAYLRMAFMTTPLRARVIVSYHSTIHVTRKDHWMHQFFTRLLRRKDKVIMVSENQAKYTIDHYGLNAAQVKVIHNGVDTSRWHLPDNSFDRAAFRAGLGIPADATVIAMTAAFRPEKNHAGAMEALQLLHQSKGIRAHLLFIGSGPQQDHVNALAQASPVAPFIVFAGNQKDVRPFLWASDLFTLTSTSVETFSIAALEAMACGLSGVLTEIGGASEMVKPGLSGKLSGLSPGEIAENWSATIRDALPPENVHRFIATNFNRGKMIREYAQEMGLPEDSTGKEQP